MKNDVPKEIISKLFELGYEEQIIDFVLAFENNSNFSISDIPLSIHSLPNNDEEVIVSKKIYDCYNEFFKRINNPLTASEIPFFLLGNRYLIDGKSLIYFEDIIYDLNEAICDYHVQNNVSKFQQLLQDSKYNIISIGHTHGNVSNKDHTLAYLAPSNLISKYQIRDTGLNISVADYWQLLAYEQIAQNQKEVKQTILMYNEEVITISNDLSKSLNINPKMNIDLENNHLKNV